MGGLAAGPPSPPDARRAAAKPWRSSNLPWYSVAVKRAGAVLAVVLTAAACASTGSAVVEQRTTQGPQAEELWVYRVTLANGREPTFEERLHWERQLDLAISRYLAKDQEYANSPNVLTFRSVRQAEVGMSKEQVVILLGAPQRTTTDTGEIEKLAFAGIRLVDITQYQTR